MTDEIRCSNCREEDLDQMIKAECRRQRNAVEKRARAWLRERQ